MSEKKELSMDELGEVSGGLSSQDRYHVDFQVPDRKQDYVVTSYKCKKCGSGREVRVEGLHEPQNIPWCCGEAMQAISSRIEHH